MSATFFIQECPTCGRNLQIRLELLGRMIACPQCEALLEACDPAMRPDRAHDSGVLLDRANQLLATAADVQKNQAR